MLLLLMTALSAHVMFSAWCKCCPAYNFTQLNVIAFTYNLLFFSRLKPKTCKGHFLWVIHVEMTYIITSVSQLFAWGEITHSCSYDPLYSSYMHITYHIQKI
jgi:hypothetical protein